MASSQSPARIRGSVAAFHLSGREHLTREGGGHSLEDRDDYEYNQAEVSPSGRKQMASMFSIEFG